MREIWQNPWLRVRYYVVIIIYELWTDSLSNQLGMYRDLISSQLGIYRDLISNQLGTLRDSISGQLGTSTYTLSC